MKQLNWYQIFGKSNIPDGRTVLPTDDIQIWLHCANIWNKAYTTLGEVLADTDTLLALITCNNAVDYMVRSTSWTISGTPKMTSNTTPSGVVSASTVYTDYVEYYAFDRLSVTDNSGKGWLPAASDSFANAYLEYDFGNLVLLNQFSVGVIKGSTTATNFKYKIQGFNGNEWVDVTSESTLPSLNVMHSYSASGTYSKIRLRYTGNSGNNISAGRGWKVQFFTSPITENATAMTYIGQNNYCANTLLADATWAEAICNSTYFESVLNVKVPKMTSNTTPEGEVVYDSTHGSYPPYQAFDGNDNTLCATANDSPTLHHFGYAFVEPVKVYFVEWIPRYDHKTRTKVRASADGSTWIDMTDFIADNLTTKQKYSTVLENPSTYRYWCCQGNVTDGNNFGMNYYTIQFYGREDI